MICNSDNVPIVPGEPWVRFARGQTKEFEVVEIVGNDVHVKGGNSGSLYVSRVPLQIFCRPRWERQ